MASGQGINVSEVCQFKLDCVDTHQIQHIKRSLVAPLPFRFAFIGYLDKS